jgi:hypothetical protein
MRSRSIWPALIVLAAILLVPGTAGSAEQPQRFIVVFKDFATLQAAPAAREISARFGARPDAVYEHALKGFAVSLPPGLASKLAADDRVAYVEQDAEVTTTATQTGATWGLDRIDQRALPLSGTYSYTATGLGVTAYIIVPASASAMESSAAGQSVATTPSTAARRTTATDTARTSPAPSADRATASRRASHSSPSACSTAAVAARSQA